MARDPLLEFRDVGISCPAGDFHIDPWRPVDRAVITHGHSDHARWGHRSYLCHKLTEPILRLRLGREIRVEGVEYGEKVKLGDATVSLHPSGHIPGSAQVRVERAGEVWVAAGDYKVHHDGISTPFEPVRCDAFVTESTFGLPIYRWESPEQIRAQINTWWNDNRAAGKSSVLTGYSLGKAQRLLSMLDRTIGPIFVHPTIFHTNGAYREGGLDIPETPVWTVAAKNDLKGAMLLMPPGAAIASALRKFEPYSIANASGWMALRGNRRRLALDRGFVVSDHGDWAELNDAIAATTAKQIFVTHGQIEPLVKWLRERGYEATAVRTRFSGDLENEEPATAEEGVNP